MSTYFIGDVHGCYNNLRTILDLISFDMNVDILHLTGDLIARGPNSLEVLRLIYSLKTSACLVLGNHELHLLKTYFKINNTEKYTHYFDTILNAPDLDELIHWLCNQPMMYIDKHRKILMTHAGIHPNWNIHNAKKSAQEIEKILSSDSPFLLFQSGNTNIPDANHINIKKFKQIQENINIFTRMRYIYNNGELDLKYKGSPKYAPKNIHPWFSVVKPTINRSNYNIIFGHWASLQNTKIPVGFYGLDSGCCWGGTLTALRWEDKKIIRVPCNPPN